MENAEITLLDGGMGTMLQAAGLPLGELPEVWNLTHPDQVTAVHRKYAEAGSRILYANTFGAMERDGRATYELDAEAHAQEGHAGN